MKKIKVSDQQKAEIDYKIEVINGFMDQFSEGVDVSRIYIQWKINARLGDVITYMLKAIDNKPNGI